MMTAMLSQLRSARRFLSSRWKSVPHLCCFCGRPVDPDTVGEGEQVGWCPHCSRVFQLPILKIPSWVAGVLLVLAVKLQAGI